MPQPRDTGRFGVALLLALALHTLIIIGTGFGERVRPRPPIPPTINVVLTESLPRPAPVDAAHLAPVDITESGSIEEEARPSSPPPEPLPAAMEAVVATPAAPPPQEVEHEQTLTAELAPIKRPEPAEPAPVDRAEVADLIEQSMEMVRMLSALDDDETRAGAGPRTHYLDAVSARSAVEAAYIEAWVRKVEQIGNLNYPDEARRRRLSGSLVLNVTLDHDGSVLRAEIVSSSGEPALDDAALRIVNLASPYASLPLEMRRRYDQLTISRTWVFRDERGMTTR